MVCTPTGIISTTDLINTDSIKEPEGSQENPPADTEQHLRRDQESTSSSPLLLQTINY